MANSNYNTVSRTKMLDYLVSNKDKAVTVQDINQFLVEQGCGVNITTIYRYLDKLSKDGRVLKHASEDGNLAMYQYIDPTSKCDEHLHLQCVRCGKVCHIDCDTMDMFKDNVMSNHGFSIQCKNSIIYGMCESCNN